MPCARCACVCGARVLFIKQQQPMARRGLVRGDGCGGWADAGRPLSLVSLCCLPVAFDGLARRFPAHACIWLRMRARCVHAGVLHKHVGLCVRARMHAVRARAPCLRFCVCCKPSLCARCRWLGRRALICKNAVHAAARQVWCMACATSARVALVRCRHLLATAGRVVTAASSDALMFGARWGTWLGSMVCERRPLILAAACSLGCVPFLSVFV